MAEGDAPLKTSGGPSAYGSGVQAIAAIVAPTTLLTAIAFYFGWTRTAAFDGYFGLTPSLIDYSTREYVLYSLAPLFLPVATVFAILIALALGHAFVKRTFDEDLNRRGLERIRDAAAVAGVLLFAVGALAAFGALPIHTDYVGSLFPAVGVVLLVYSVALRHRLRGEPPLSAGAHAVVGLFVALCLFWAAGLYAGSVGRSQAHDLAAHLDRLPGVTLFSKDDLQLDGAGVTEESVCCNYRFEYQGLRLFSENGGILYLIPNQWDPAESSSVFAITDDDTIRIELAQGDQSVQSGASAAESPAFPTAPFTPPTVTRIRLSLTPKSQSVPPGGSARFVIRVVNVGNVKLTFVTVVDPLAPACNRKLKLLAVGASRSYACKLSTAQLSNVATATAKGPKRRTVSSSDRAIVR